MIAEIGLAALWLAAALAALQLATGLLAVRASAGDDGDIRALTRPAAVVQGVMAAISFVMRS